MKSAVGWEDDDVNRIRDQFKGNYFAYVGNKDITLAFYKRWLRVKLNQGKEICIELWCNYNSQHNHMSHTYKLEDYKIHVKTVVKYKVFLCDVTIDGHHYHVIYGYGIDPNMIVWNNVKNIYLGKRDARKVDNLINRFWRIRT